jgi:hypothetical protein
MMAIVECCPMAHLQFELCNPIGENIKMVPREKIFQGDCREQKRNIKRQQ